MKREESAYLLNRKKLLSIVFLNRMRQEMDGRFIVQNCVTLRASFLAFPVFLRAKRMDCYLLARLARETERVQGVLRSDTP